MKSVSSFFKGFFALLILNAAFSASIAFAQAVAEREDFDSVTAPALPAGWSSTRPGNLGVQNAATSTTNFDSPPNAAFIPAPSTVSQTALVSKVYAITSNLPTTSIDVDFKHKRGMEANFDGVVLEISVNGGAFIDVTNPSIGGNFTQGGYNINSLSVNFANPLGGRPAWTGSSAGFENVSLNLPQIPENSTIQFRFVMGTDSSNGGTGWYMDDFTVEVAVNISTTLTAITPEIAPGGIAELDATTFNPTSFQVSSGATYVSTPVSRMRSIAFSVSSFYQRVGKWIGLVSSFETLSPFTTSDTLLEVTDIPGQAGAKLTITATNSAPFLNISAPLAFLSSSSNIPGGLLSKGTELLPFDPCGAIPNPLPYPIADKIVVYPGTPSCGFGPASLILQNLGASAAIFVVSPAGVFPPYDYPSPVVTEAATVGLNIPVFTFDQTSSPFLLAAFGLPGSVAGRLEGNNSAELRTIPVSYSQIAGDSIYGDNTPVTLINVVTDVDGDGTPDIRDSCKADNRKTTPGVCGCGIVDLDSNANGVADCLIASDYRAQMNKLLGLVKKLKLTNKSYKDNAKQIRELSKGVSTIGIASLSTLAKSADKSVKAVLKAKTPDKLALASKGAKKNLQKLINAIVG